MDTEPGGHETHDVNVRAVVLAGAGLFAVATLLLAVLVVQFRSLLAVRARENPPPLPLAAAAPTEPPAPRLQVSLTRDLEALRASEDALLHGYGWVDRRAGVVRLDIGRAMELVAREAAK